MIETLEGIVVSKIETTTPTSEKYSAVGNAEANHQFREVAKMIPHEEVDVSKMETTTSTREKSSAVGIVASQGSAIIMNVRKKVK